MGFIVANNGVQWLPRTPGEWLIFDDVLQSWPVEDQPNASGWQVVGYNDDVYYPHAVTVRFHVAAVESPSPGEPTITFVTTPTPREPLGL